MVLDKLISSPHNPFIKEVVRLRQRSHRDDSGLFLIEGYRELRRAIDAGWRLDTLYYCQEMFLGANEGLLLDDAAAAGARLIAATPAVFQKISYRDRPDGLLAVAPQRHMSLADLEPLLAQRDTPPLFVVAEAIEKPGNLGTILRSCDATRVSALIVCDRCTDIYNPNVVRASVGTLFTVPVVEASGDAALRWLQSHAIAVAAATPHSDSLWCHVDMRQPLALAVGTEQLGLSPLWMDNATLKVAIPMLGVADSLNVATATTLLLYEAVRQRQHGA